MSAIGIIVRIFQQNWSVENRHARTVRSAENIAVRNSVAEDPLTSNRRRAQLNISQTSLLRILIKNLNLHAYKIQLTQELTISKRRQYAE